MTTVVILLGHGWSKCWYHWLIWNSVVVIEFKVGIPREKIF